MAEEGYEVIHNWMINKTPMEFLKIIVKSQLQQWI